MGTEQDIEHLGEAVSELLKIVLEVQVEIQALEAVLVERHGLSLEVLREHRVQAQQRQDAIRVSVESGNQKLERFRGPTQ